ncbi:hypothetical protein ColTof4_13165 [Colletotrichum tofieldiae]|nr:hypothetical protein ColTof3_00201 [Colletotrichum tofieldiae]GKT80742.1 hypothetical protein ColTof4_13165 [Colletotrichum tofieldiae]GKT88872.1 hypothetical protein Ct61P_06722 [Colletotrichum tofieldiae]
MLETRKGSRRLTSLYSTFKRASDDIATLASHLGLSRIILGGHDWGVVYRAAMWHPELVAAFYVLSTPFAAPQALYVNQALEWPRFHHQLQLRTNAIQDYIRPVDAQNVTRVRQILNTIYRVTGPSNELSINVTDIRLDFDLLDGVTKDTPPLSKREMDFYVENFSSKPFNNTLNWYSTNKLNWEYELALVPSNACTIHHRNPGPCAASGSVDGDGNVL